MKIIAGIVVLLFLTMQTSAQLANTEWSGTLNVPEPTACILRFKTDTLFVIYAGADAIPMRDKDGNVNYVSGKDSFSIETMSYSASGDSMTIQKISGGSPCENNAIGKYTFTIKDRALTFTKLSDDCEMRQSAWQDVMLRKL